MAAASVMRLGSAFAIGDGLFYNCFCYRRGAVDAAPALPKPEHYLVVAFAKIRRDIVFYPEGVLVELRHGGLHHFVTDLHSVYIHLVVAQRGYGDRVADLTE